MSFTRTVPPGVPSLFQSSKPCAASKAAKKRVPFTLTREEIEPAETEGNVASRMVPASVPSLFQRPSSGFAELT
jgi:hypothetical protein